MDSRYNKNPLWANIIAGILVFLLVAVIVVPLLVWVGREMWGRALG